jgi:hypothetical protein
MEPDEAPAAGPAAGPSPPTKTPMYQAIHASRYHRQELIKQIQHNRGAQLISYVSGIANLINRDDVLGFGDLLHNVRPNGNLDLLLHTPGGDIDAAEKLINMVRARVGLGRLRVVVPDFAKSAGTLMALGADTIVMSETSELGPIDPQITLRDPHGNLLPHSVQAYLDAYETHAAAVRANPGDAAAHLMLSKLDPATIKLCRAACDRAQKFAESQLQSGMFRSGEPGNFTKIAADLMDTKKWLSHGQMIGADAARTMGLNVEYLDMSSPEWQAYWRLYCLQRLAVSDKQKLFESDYASLPFDGHA